MGAAVERTVRKFLTTPKTDLPYDLATPLLDIYPDRTLTQKDKHSVFTAALFTAKAQKQPKFH